MNNAHNGGLINSERMNSKTKCTLSHNSITDSHSRELHFVYNSSQVNEPFPKSTLEKVSQSSFIPLDISHTPICSN